MIKKAVILDLDNTVYGVSTIGEAVFAPLFECIWKSGAHSEAFEGIKSDIMRKPYQVVADEYGFSQELRSQGLQLLTGIRYEGPIAAFSDYVHTRRMSLDKYLVTTGFTELQNSKIDGMNIRNDFTEIHIVDPARTTHTKKDVFADIMQRHGYRKEEMLVVGDDLHSEIKAAQQLGIDAVLYDKYNTAPHGLNVPAISDFEQLLSFF